jgi:hypothetical protein
MVSKPETIFTSGARFYRLAVYQIKVALAHPAASNGVCSRQRFGFNGY